MSFKVDKFKTRMANEIRSCEPSKLTINQVYLYIIIHNDIHSNLRPFQVTPEKWFENNFTTTKLIKENSKNSSKILVASTKTYNLLYESLKNSGVRKIEDLATFALNKLMERYSCYDFKEVFKKVITEDGIPTKYRMKYYKNGNMDYVHITHRYVIDEEVLKWCSCFVEFKID